MKSRPSILVFAGFDPSGGAGILADIKTCEQNKVLGMAICTCNTVQNENKLEEVDWIDESFIFHQLKLLVAEHQFKYIKLGLVPSLSFIRKLTSIPEIKQAKIIWDPVLSSSSGYNFNLDLKELIEVLKKVYIITPNWNEIKQLSGEEDSKNGAIKLSGYTNVFLKGGHNPKQIGRDYLFVEKGTIFPFKPRGKKVYPKHGSGCIFSTALASYLARGFKLNKACLKSKEYVTQALESNKSLLAYHKR